MKFSEILTHSTIDNVEDLLCTQLKNIDLIGQIELDETSYSHLMKLMYNNYFLGDLKRGSIPPALFLTSMVFCARYSSEQSRKFWEPYAQIWKQKPDANFQRWCREHFIKSSIELSRRFGFEFPKKTSGDVVRPVYFHALIPAHLKDDFAAWLNQMLPDFMRMDLEQIANDLEDRTYYIAPTLRTFLLSDDTQPAALALIAEMMDSVRLYQDGEKSEDIWNYLSSIIEREIWEQLLPNIQTGNLPRKRILQPKIEWIWDLDSGQMLLRVRDILTAPEYKPYQLVVSQPNQSIYDSDWRERVYSWEKPDGTWYIDEHIIDDVTNDSVGYHISVVDIDDHLIVGSRLLIPSLPKDDIVFCRITQQDVYAIPVPKSTSYPDSDWIVLLKESSSIDTALEPFYKPDLLELEYASAFRGFIRFPVIVQHEDGTEEQLESRYSFTIQAELQGERLESISRKVPPVFSDTRVHLKLNAPAEQVRRLKLQIEQDGRIIKQFRLSQIEIQTQAGHFTIDLSQYLQNLTGKFTLNLVRGISSVLNNPIQFSILPQISILEYPDQEKIYHADNLPHALLKSHDHHVKIECDENSVVIKELQEGILQITWTALQKTLCSIVIDGVPLAWEIQRVWAWIEHSDLDEIKGIKDLSNAWLHVRGLRYQDIEISVNNAIYSLKLDAKGQFNTLIEQDRIYDLIKTEASGNIRLEIHSEYGNWILWERIGNVGIEHTDINYDPFSQQITANIKLSYPLSGRFEYRVRSSEKQLFVGYYNSLQLTDTLDIQIPLSLRAGQYQLKLLYRGALLPSEPKVMDFIVIGIVDSFIQSTKTPNQQGKLRLLSLKKQEFDEVSDEELQHYWKLLHYITRARNTTELLPSWAVTENAFSCSIIFAGAVKQITLYPEMVLHKGQTGIGKTPLIVNGDIQYAYVRWESLSKHQSTIRFWLPQGFPPNFWDLETDDMYPVYYSKRYLQFYAKEGYPTPQEIREQDLIEVSYENSLPCEIYPSQRFLQHSLKAHYIVDRRYFIAKLEYDNKYNINKPQANDYRSAIDDFLKIESVRANRKQILKFLASDSKYRMMLETFEGTLKSHTIIGNTTLSHVTLRFIQSALLWSDNKDHNYYHLERLIMLLSLALRLRAYYPHLSKEIDVLIPENDLIELVTFIEQIAPELFIWSLTWVELFALHAIS